MQDSNKENLLSKKELAFCYQYIKTGNAKEAAMLAGYKNNPEQKGTELMAKSKISQKVEEIYFDKKKNLIYKAMTGYERLAFGSISDSVKLLFAENLRSEDLDKMNLFNISEIKKPKDGAMEIKFFDRLRALEKLEQVDIEQKGDKDPFYYALEQGIKKLSASEKIQSEN